ncbi:hypothetical protein [Rhodococcus pyridinivorans]
MDSFVPPEFTVEDVHDLVDGLVGTSDLFHVELALRDLEQRVQAVAIGACFVAVVRKGREERLQTLAEQLGYVDPAWIVGHFRRHVELEQLQVDVEIQACECGGVTFEEGRQSPSHHAVQGGEAAARPGEADGHHRSWSSR